jgi:hypothetical protein
LRAFVPPTDPASLRLSGLELANLRPDLPSHAQIPAADAGRSGKPGGAVGAIASIAFTPASSEIRLLGLRHLADPSAGSPDILSANRLGPGALHMAIGYEPRP